MPLTKKFSQKKKNSLRAKIIQLSGQARPWGSSPLFSDIAKYFRKGIHCTNTTGEVMWLCNVTATEHETETCELLVS